MKNALIYSRVSTEEQAQDGRHSLSAQRNLCLKLAKEMGYEVLGVFEDPGKSATNMNRPGLQDMLIRCQEDKSINAVFVQDTDRIARNTNDHLSIKALLKKADVKLVSVSQPTIDETAEGQMIDTIIASVNQFQSDITSRKTKKGLEEKVRKGGWPRLAPLGYKNVTDKSGKKIVVIDEVKGPLIQEAFKMYAIGSYAGKEVAEIMYKKGLTSFIGKKLHNSKIIYLLKNRFYLGEINWDGIIVKKALHKPLIDERTFNAVQEVMANHNHNATRARKYRYLLTGFLFCAECGSRYTGETHAEKGISYYRCSRRIGHQGKCINTLDLEKQVEESFKYLQFSQRFINMVVTRVRRLYESRKKDIEKNKRVLLNQKQAIEQKRDTAEEKLINGTISDEDFTRIKTKLRERMDHLQDQIDEVERIRNIKIDEIQEVLKLTRNIYKAYREAPEKLKRPYLSLFWDKFEMKQGKLIKAIPTKLFSAIMADYQQYYFPTQKPANLQQVYLRFDGGSLVRADHYPIQPAFEPAKVQIRAGWGA